MTPSIDPAPHTNCAACREGTGLDFAISMAFQPIVDVPERRVFAYEALVRGPAGEGAGWVIAQVTPEQLYGFDQACRVTAIEKSVDCGIVPTGAALSINFLPNAVYSPQACIQATLKAARATGFPTDRLIFEFTESEQMARPEHVANIIASYRKMGFGTAIDDFGAGHAGLTLFAHFAPDTIKIDMDLVRGIDRDPRRRAIVTGLLAMCADLDTRVIAEGIETAAEYECLRDLGVRYMQGYLLAKPAFEALPEVCWPG